MKFIHLADLHLGKIIYQKNLLELQKDLLKQVIDYMNTEGISLLVIAGDVYDRSIPSNDAVNVLNDFLDELIYVHHKKVIMISGNHDSSDRLNFASTLLKKQGLYISSYVEKELKPIIIDDVNFYLVPFFKPSTIKYLYNNDDIQTYQDAYDFYLKQQNIDYEKTNVLVTHQFVAGNNNAITSESEVILSVGGSEIIDVDLFKDFDYVALGHLHASQKIKYDYVRYAGSLMKYSFDEVSQTKGMVEVSIEDGNVSTTTIPLKPQRDLIKVKGLYKDLLKDKPNSNDYVAIELHDERLVPQAIDYLSSVYTNILQLTYPKVNAMSSESNTKANIGFEKLSPIDLFEEFYKKLKDSDMKQEEKQIISNILEDGDLYDA